MDLSLLQSSVNIVQPKSPLQGIIPSLFIVMSHLQKQVCKIQSWLIKFHVILTALSPLTDYKQSL